MAENWSHDPRQSPESLRSGDAVFSSDGHHVGKLHEVVVDADNDELTRVVVNAGPFFPMPGFGAPKLVSVPIAKMHDLGQRRITLRCSRSTFEHLPLYADWAISGELGTADDHTVQRMAVATKVPDRLPTERELARGMRILMDEPRVHIGEVERVLVDEGVEHVKALVIRVGLLLGHLVVLPIQHVVYFGDGVIHVQMTAKEIEELEKYEGPPDG